MSVASTTPFVRLRKGANDAKIFGFGGQPPGTDMRSPANLARKTRELIRYGIAANILTARGTLEDRKTVALALDRDSCRTINAAASRIHWPSSDAPATRQAAPAYSAQTTSQQSVNARVEQARKHGSHGFTGDPKLEYIQMTNTTTTAQSDPDDGSDVVELARKVGLRGFTKQEDTATAFANSDNDGAITDPDDPSDVLELARQVGLRGFQ